MRCAVCLAVSHHHWSIVLCWMALGKSLQRGVVGDCWWQVALLYMRPNGCATVDGLSIRHDDSCLLTVPTTLWLTSCTWMSCALMTVAIIACHPHSKHRGKNIMVVFAASKQCGRGLNACGVLMSSLRLTFPDQDGCRMRPFLRAWSACGDLSTGLPRCTWVFSSTFMLS